LISVVRTSDTVQHVPYGERGKPYGSSFYLCYAPTKVVGAWHWSYVVFLPLWRGGLPIPRHRAIRVEIELTGTLPGTAIYSIVTVLEENTSVCVGREEIIKIKMS
jgi:hypothetical protein